MPTGQLIQGTKFDQGKLRWDLLPWDALKEVVRVLTFGANKYEARNWEKGMNYDRPAGAMFRHHSAWVDGEAIDEECQTHHLANLIVEALFLLTYELRGMNQFDNYTKAGGTRQPVLASSRTGVQPDVPAPSFPSSGPELERSHGLFIRREKTADRERQRQLEAGLHESVHTAP